MTKTRGATLIELAIVLVITGILATVIGPLLITTVQTAHVATDSSNVFGQGTTALMRMTRDIRNIRDNNAADLIMAASSITLTDVHGDSVTYAYTSPNITRDGTPLARANNLNFTYLGANGAPTSTVTDVRYIKVSYSVTNNDVSQTFLNTVFLRNSN